MGGPNTSTAKSRDYSKLPILRLTAAEKAEKTKLGLCWYCSEKWATGHVCKGRFLAYIGPDDDEEAVDDTQEPTAAAEVVMADISHVFRMDGRPRSSALQFQGFLRSAEVFVLVDTGSTHNFVHPRIAERVKLPLRAIKPFRIYVGNGQSLVCSELAPDAEIRIQGHSLRMDLHILDIHGPEVILGLAWLTSLQRVTSDYSAGTLEFHLRGRAVCLKVTPRIPRKISAHTFAAIMLHQEAGECFELLQLEESGPTSSAPLELPEDLPTAVRETLLEHSAVFEVPKGLPPSRTFDHRIHLLPNTKPVNVRPYS